jgi:hypothetical protein
MLQFRTDVCARNGLGLIGSVDHFKATGLLSPKLLRCQHQRRTRRRSGGGFRLLWLMQFWGFLAAFACNTIAMPLEIPNMHDESRYSK